jgi:hypothetical protein
MYRDENLPYVTNIVSYLNKKVTNDTSSLKWLDIFFSHLLMLPLDRVTTSKIVAFLGAVSDYDLAKFVVQLNDEIPSVLTDQLFSFLMSLDARELRRIQPLLVYSAFDRAAAEAHIANALADKSIYVQDIVDYEGTRPPKPFEPIKRY